MSESQLARASGISQAAISRIEAGLREPAADTLRRLAAALNVSADYLLGLTDAPASATERDREMAARDARIRDLEGRPGDDEPWRYPLLNETYSSAGPGAHVTNERSASYVPFRQDWSQRHGLHPSHCDVIGVRGDSMEPTLQDGAWILVDRRRTEPRDGKVFVVRAGDETLVKRLRRVRSGGWWLVSDNRSRDAETGRPTHPPRSFPLAGGAIIGQVMWAGKTL